MPKYWGKQIFTHGRFPEVCQKQKTEKTEKTAEKSAFFRKKIKFTPQQYFFLLISSIYAKILGGKLFSKQEFPRSGSKAKDGEKDKEEREKERKTELW